MKCIVCGASSDGNGDIDCGLVVCKTLDDAVKSVYGEMVQNCGGEYQDWMPCSDEIIDRNHRPPRTWSADCRKVVRQRKQLRLCVANRRRLKLTKGTTMRNRIIFLDCDGVLNRAQLTDMRYFVPECFKEFQWIVQATDAQIVISSTWRTYDAWYDMLKDFFGAIDITVIGKTTENADGDKAEEIKNYIQEHRSEISNYVVLDDIDFREQFPGHCVCTCAPGRIGLDAEWATEAINILTRKSDEQNT